MYTAEQAKELWCPMVRLAPAPMHPALNRLLNGNEVRQPRASCCIANKCAMWRWADGSEGLGYCGLAPVHGVAS